MWMRTLSTSEIERELKWRLITLACLVALAFSCSISAQPQAPITWGEARWFGIGCNWLDGQVLYSAGDTVVVVDQVRDTTLPNQPWYPRVTSSLDNGLTWRPWQRLLNDSVHAGSIETTLTCSDGRIYAFVDESRWDGYWVVRSTDGGENWTPIRQSQPAWSACGLASGDQVAIIEGHLIAGDRTAWQSFMSFDRGTNWNTGSPITTETTSIRHNSIGFTRDHAIAIGIRSPFGNVLERVYYSTSNREGETWSDFQQLPGQTLVEFCVASLAGDTSSETAIEVSVWFPNAGSSQSVYIHRTTDGGATWENPRLLTDRAYYNAVPVIFCRGKLWGVAWADPFGLEPSQRGLYCRISSNHGKDWYPAQRADSVYRAVYYAGGQFTDDEVRLYYQGVATTDTFFENNDYRTAIGVLTPDTVQPEVSALQRPMDTVAVNENLVFLVHAHDNDTLSEVRVVIRSDQDSAWASSMSRQTEDSFAVNWTVPREGFYRYRIEAEDFWENVASIPDTGWFSFTAGPLEVYDHLPPTPFSFSLSTFPNPFNATAAISFLLPMTGAVKIAMFDIMGRSVRVLIDGLEEAGPHQITLNAEGMASGIYFVRMESAGRAVTGKMVLLR
jgi:hypothetical protein